MNTPPKIPVPNNATAGHIQKPAWQNIVQRKPVAPPVYRPQPVPKVLQTKRAPGLIPQPHQVQRQPVEPPVYRPEVNKSVQPKTISPQRNLPTPPPAYRPQQTTIAQPKIASPIHRPQQQRGQPPQMKPTMAASSSIIQRSGGKRTKEEEEKKARRRQRFTRIIRLDQLNRPTIGIKTTRKSRGSLTRNLPGQFDAKGRHSTTTKGLYTYMRRYGGAGIQGVHRGIEGKSRGKVVHGVLSKMATDPKRKTGRRGPKFAMIGIDPSRLNADQLLDTTTSQTRAQFSGDYGGPGSRSGRNYMKMFDRHASEGVVGLIGNIPLEAIMGLRAFRGVPTEEELEEIIEELVMSDEEEDDDLTPECSGNGFNFGSGWPPPPGDGSGGAGITA